MLINYFLGFPLQPILIPLTVEKSRLFRTGAEEEYSIRSKSGPFKVLPSPHLPKVMLKDFESEFEKYICPHPSLRKYHSLSPFIEPTSERQLLFKQVQFADDLDPLLDVAGIEVLKEEYYNKVVGRGVMGWGWTGGAYVYANSNAIIGGSITDTGKKDGLGTIFGGWENRAYLRVKEGRLYDFGFEEKFEKGCRGYMGKEDEEDRFSDTDSDGDGPPDVLVKKKGEYTIFFWVNFDFILVYTSFNFILNYNNHLSIIFKVENHLDFLKKIEGDDKIILELKSKNEAKVEDVRSNIKNNMNKNVNLQRDIAGSISSTKSEGINRFIGKSDLKILII
jgi:hypothetical protein